jgi:hypothetical protein
MRIGQDTTCPGQWRTIGIAEDIPSPDGENLENTYVTCRWCRGGGVAETGGGGGDTILQHSLHTSHLWTAPAHIFLICHCSTGLFRHLFRRPSAWLARSQYVSQATTGWRYIGTSLAQTPSISFPCTDVLMRSDVEKILQFFVGHVHVISGLGQLSTYGQGGIGTNICRT